MLIADNRLILRRQGFEVHLHDMAAGPHPLDVEHALVIGDDMAAVFQVDAHTGKPPGTVIIRRIATSREHASHQDVPVAQEVLPDPHTGRTPVRHQRTAVGTGNGTVDDITVADAEETVVEPEQRDANVVSLFRGRATSVAGTDHDLHNDADDHDDDAGDEHQDTRPDVGGIFARLRSESPDGVAEPEPLSIDPVIDELEELEELEELTDAGQDVEQIVEQIVEPTPFSRRQAAIVPLIVAGARKIKRSLADEQNGVLDTLRQNEPVRSLDDLLPEIAVHLKVYVAALEDDLVAAAAAGAGELGINDTKTLRRRLTKTGALEATHDLLRTDLLRPLRDRLDRAISEGSGDNEDITKRVRAVYREWKTQRIDDQLDDVFRFAYGGGLAISVEPGTPLTWTIDPDHAACPDCEDNSLAGSVAAGEAFPTGHTAAPAHPGCRCLTLPGSQ